MSRYTEGSNPMPKQWDDFLWTFGSRGYDSLVKAERRILSNPYSREFESPQSLINSDAFPSYHVHDQIAPASTFKGLAYLVNYARSERKLREHDMSNDTASKDREKKSVIQPPTKIGEAKCLPTVLYFGKLGKGVLRALTAQASIHPYADNLKDQLSVSNYMNQSSYPLSQYTQYLENYTLREISQYISSFAENQRKIQEPYRDILISMKDEISMEEHRELFLQRFYKSTEGPRTLTRMQESVEKHPKDDMFRSYNSQGLRDRFGTYLTEDKEAAEHGMKYIFQLASKKREDQLISAIEKLARPDEDVGIQMESKKDEARRMEDFVSNFGTKQGMGKFGANFLTRLKTYIESPEFNPDDFTDKDSVAKLLKKDKWSYMQRIALHKPNLHPSVIDWAHWLGRTRMESVDQDQSAVLSGGEAVPSSSAATSQAGHKRTRQSATPPEDKRSTQKQNFGLSDFTPATSSTSIAGLQSLGDVDDEALERHRLMLFGIFAEDMDYLDEYEEETPRAGVIDSDLARFWRGDDEDCFHVDVDEDLEKITARSLFPLHH
ncbi:uncharacterized protein L199_001069 [Kwoniella botswanensis]|uniref:uncharacterized protein n=1 Tax=Kwoniella botswanensis TaxID=1268659 RepID=UPI00315D7A3D